MKDEATLETPELAEIILVPVEASGATDVPIRDEKGGIILSETGIPVCEG